MKIKKLFLIPSIALVSSIASPAILISCSAPVDQEFIDKFYSDIVNRTNWTGNADVYASSIYDLKTFRDVFKDQIPSDDELMAKGFVASIEEVISYDKLGKSNYTIYLRDIKNQKTYLPTPSNISDDNDEKEPIISFEISGFLQATDIVTTSFQNAYEAVNKNPPLNLFGKNFFETKNIEDNISFDDINSSYYVGKLFEPSSIPNFETASFQKISIDDEKKEVTFRLFLSSEGKVKGPGTLVTLSL